MEAKRQVKYIIGITLIVVSIFVIFLVFKSNQIMDNMNASETSSTKVLILTTDRLNDQSWGSLAYKGKILIEEEYNVTAEVLGEVDAEKDTSSLVEEYVDQDYELIIGHGREFSEPFYRIINQYKDVQFVTIHGDNIANNLAVYTFNQNEVEVIAGMAAGLKTKSKKIGLIDAVDNKHKDWGFPQGIELIDDKIELIYKVVPERTNKSDAKLFAANLIEEGVDVIYTKGNSYNQEVINYAKEHGIYIIGYLEDQSYMAEDKVLTSVLNNVPMAYSAILRDFLSEEGIKFEKKYLDVDDGVYGIAPFGSMFSEDEIQTIEEVTDHEIPR
ncbi:BMP family ABC transporter substrate-binding protein [Gracilibacillus salitolerans]|uniref:BMP family ABC transporter substrate-binding protein n=1 Tax=Gracilibacillus salitolerans TaxID=2663022 RepID=A0A5Q2TJL0_9BACI|nr:BMP family ABC transporter substrate-binding protein [Gracilibacillus salitolerans]QGH34865.1 BMP family ABC transporter substrate-binding protein [Gracilibacillus salitolerans]